MKKLNSKLYQDNQLNERMHDVLGGAEGNGSDKNYPDTKIDGTIKWDVATQKLIDIEITSRANDKPQN